MIRISVTTENGHHIWVPVPKHLAVHMLSFSLKKTRPDFKLNKRELFRVLRRYKGMTIVEVEQAGGDKVKIKI